MTINPASGSNNYIAKAYGLNGITPVARIAPSAPSTSVQAPSQVRVAADLGSVSLNAAKMPSSAQKLVAAVVPGKIDFSGDQPVQSSGLSMYRHPADRNAAATAVSLGRALDIRG